MFTKLFIVIVLFAVVQSTYVSDDCGQDSALSSVWVVGEEIVWSVYSEPDYSELSWVCMNDLGPCNETPAGDFDYCTGHECNSSSTCMCYKSPNSTVLRDGLGRLVSNGFICEELVVETRSLRNEVPIPHEMNCLITLKDYLITFVCDNGIYTPQPFPRYSGYWQIAGLSDSFESWEETWIVALPESVHTLSGTLLVYATNNNAIMSSLVTFDLIGMNYCEIHDCLFCWDIFTSYSCLPNAVRKTILCLVIIFTIFIASATYIACLKVLMISIQFLLYVFWLVSKCVTCPYCCWKTRLMRGLRRKLSSNASKVKKALSEAKATEEGDATLPKVEVYKPTVGARAPWTFLVLLLLLPVCSAQSCSVAPSVTASITSCSTAGSTETCAMTLNMQVTIPLIGTAACFSVLDTAGKVLGSLKLIYWGATDLVTGSMQYYTGDYDVYSQSNYHCLYASVCNPTNCNKITGENDRDAMGQLSSELIYDRPGITECRRSGGGWGNGCFYMDPGCVFSGWGIVPKYIPMRAIKLMSRVRVHNFGYEWKGLNTVAENFTTDGNQVVGTYATMTIVSALDGYMHDFSGLYLYTNLSVSYIAPASVKNAPIKNTAGDIQGQTYTSLTEPSATSFIFNPDIVTETDGAKKTTYTSHGSGINSPNKARLPYMYDGTFWMASGDGLIGMVTTTGPITVSIQTQSPISVKRLTTAITVVPTTAAPIVSGCYSCPTGAVAQVGLYSSTTAGTVGVSSTTITVNTRALSITTSPLLYNISFVSAHKVVNDLLLISDGNNNLWVQLNGVLEDYVAPVTNTSDVVQSLSNDPVEGDTCAFFCSWSHDFTSGHMSWIEWIFTIALFGFGTFVIIFAVTLAYKLIKFLIPATPSKQA